MGAAALSFGFLVTVGPAQSEERVLLLSSFAPGDYLIEPIENGIRERLSSRSGLRFSVEYLDVEHDPEGTHLAWLKDYLAQKYATAKLDAIIALGEPALQFALRSRDNITRSAPIIFGQVPVLTPADVAVMPNVTGRAGGLRAFRDLRPYARTTSRAPQRPCYRRQLTA